MHSILSSNMRLRTKVLNYLFGFFKTNIKKSPGDKTAIDTNNKIVTKTKNKSVK